MLVALLPGMDTADGKDHIVGRSVRHVAIESFVWMRKLLAFFPKVMMIPSRVCGVALIVVIDIEHRVLPIAKTLQLVRDTPGAQHQSVIPFVDDKACIVRCHNGSPKKPVA
jgi:hypothetical protein